MAKMTYEVDRAMCGDDESLPGFNLHSFCDFLQWHADEAGLDLEVVVVDDPWNGASNDDPSIMPSNIWLAAQCEYADSLEAADA